MSEEIENDRLPPPVEPTQEQEPESEEGPNFELGDRVLILGGRYNGTRGRIYYMDTERLRILPDGVSDRLIEILFVEGDLDPSLNIEKFLLLTKRAEPAFVSQIDAHVGDIAETFGIGGEMGTTFTVESINEEEDSLVLVDETEGRKEIMFDFTGIPLDEPFAVLRTRQPPLPISEEDANATGPVTGDIEEDEFEFLEDVDEEVRGLQEIPSTQRFYSDTVQRDDAVQEILGTLSIAARKDPKKQKEIGREVEMTMLMRNELVRYSETGEPAGQKQTSYQTLGELLTREPVPLSRPILNVDRSVYLEHSDDRDTDTVELPGRAVQINYLEDTLTSSNEFMATQLGGLAGNQMGADTLPAWFLSFEAFFQRFFRTWVPNDTVGGEPILFVGDKDFIRAPGPTSDPTELTNDGITKAAGADKKVPITADSIGKVKPTLMRGLGPRATRLRPKDSPRHIESADEAAQQGQLLFPRSTERDLGSTRSGRLIKDITHSHTASKTLQTLLETLGGIPDEASAGKILSVGPDGNTSGNIAIEDWLRLQPFSIRGLGDALVELRNIGLSQKELTVDQQEVLLEKLQQFRAILKQHITEERQLAAKALADLRLTSQNFLQGEALEEFIAVLSEEPLLAARVSEWKAQYPAYKDNDMGLFAGVSYLMSDLLITALAGVPGPLARERNRRVRDQFLEALRAALAKANKSAAAGELPMPNRCPHVASLIAIRKTDDDVRMPLMAKFLAQFQGERQNNWIECAVCKQHLICYHEALQIQEYLHPREKDQLHKELLLAFSGGVFQGNYMCKNCGQSIQTLEFDMNMEFDDDGRPMMGRATMVNQDDVEEEALEQILGVPATAPEQVTFATETQNLLYKTGRQILDRVGIFLDRAAYTRLVQRAEMELQRLPTREEYARLEANKKKEAKDAGRPWRGLDYDIMINKNLVSIVGAHILIEIQTHMPDLVLRYRLPGCKAGFSGFPIGREQDKTGIDYISCGIASIKKNAAPWNMTGFLREASDKKRQEIVSKLVENYVREALKTAAVQQRLTEKRAYYQELYGAAEFADQLAEAVPTGFRPVPYYITPEEATQNIVVPAAAGPTETARVWIQAGHRLARQNGSYVRGSPFSETSCCFTAVDSPRGFWDEKGSAMPTLGPRRPSKGRTASEVILSFTPRRLAKLLADPPEELFYRVFLQVCYTGPRKGYPHEPGFTNICPHCGFVFPEFPYTTRPAPPVTSDKALIKDYQADVDSILSKGKTALETQKVPINRDTFNDVLDTVHTNFRVVLPERVEPNAGVALLRDFADITPEPFQGWRSLMAQTIDRVSKLPPQAQEIEVADAYGALSNHVVEVLGEIQRRINSRSASSLQALFTQTPTAIVETFRSYLLIPFQRLCVDYKYTQLKVPKAYKLSPETEEDLHKILNKHFEYMTQLRKLVKGYALPKLAYARDRLAQVLPRIQASVRSPFFPGGQLGVPYFVGALLGGILTEFINPNFIPSVAGVDAPAVLGAGAVDTSARAPLQILDASLQRIQIEAMNFSEQQIRDIVGKRIESEKEIFIDRLNKLTPEEKKVEMMKKRLGLGEWAVGGTKAIRVYNPEQYEREREQRIQMGLGDFLPPDAGPLFGDDDYGGGGAGAEGGYDVGQMAADDF